MTPYHIGPIRTSLYRFWLWLYDMLRPSFFHCDERDRKMYNNTRNTYCINSCITSHCTFLKMTTYRIGPIRISLFRFWLWLYDMSHPSCSHCDQRERQIYSNTRTTYGINCGITYWRTCLAVTTCHVGHTCTSLCAFRVWLHNMANPSFPHCDQRANKIHSHARTTYSSHHCTTS